MNRFAVFVLGVLAAFGVGAAVHENRKFKRAKDENDELKKKLLNLQHKRISDWKLLVTDRKLEFESLPVPQQRKQKEWKN